MNTGGSFLTLWRRPPWIIGNYYISTKRLRITNRYIDIDIDIDRKKDTTEKVSDFTISSFQLSSPTNLYLIWNINRSLLFGLPSVICPQRRRWRSIRWRWRKWKRRSKKNKVMKTEWRRSKKMDATTDDSNGNNHQIFHLDGRLSWKDWSLPLMKNGLVCSYQGTGSDLPFCCIKTARALHVYQLR